MPLFVWGGGLIALGGLVALGSIYALGQTLAATATDPRRGLAMVAALIFWGGWLGLLVSGSLEFLGRPKHIAALFLPCSLLLVAGVQVVCSWSPSPWPGRGAVAVLMGLLALGVAGRLESVSDVAHPDEFWDRLSIDDFEEFEWQYLRPVEGWRYRCHGRDE